MIFSAILKNPSGNGVCLIEKGEKKRQKGIRKSIQSGKQTTLVEQLREESHTHTAANDGKKFLNLLLFYG